MAYIQVDQSLLTHRKTLRLARLLAMDRYAVAGRLVALWSWCLDNAPRGFLEDVDAPMLADVMGYVGSPSDLENALLVAGFLDIDGDGNLCVHGWDETMLPYIERKEKNAARMREARAQAKDQAKEPIGDSASVCNERALHVQRTSSARADVEERRGEERRSTVDTDGEDSLTISAGGC
jgi:hypothetical protein